MGNLEGVWSGRKNLEFLKRKTSCTTSSSPSTTRPRRPSLHQASALASVFPYHGYVLITYELFFVLTCFVLSYTARTSTIRRDRHSSQFASHPQLLGPGGNCVRSSGIVWGLGAGGPRSFEVCECSRTCEEVALAVCVELSCHVWLARG